MTAPEIYAELTRRLQDPTLRDMPGAPIPTIHCQDGFNVSIQAGKYHYCSPRDNHGPWDSFELCFPSVADPLITLHAEDPDNLTQGVYGWVPLATVVELIQKHGGFA